MQKDVQHRARMLYYLGLSLSALLDLTNGPNTVRAFSQLMEEWEYTFDAVPAIQGREMWRCLLYETNISVDDKVLLMIMGIHVGMITMLIIVTVMLMTLMMLMMILMMMLMLILMIILVMIHMMVMTTM